MKKIYTTNEWNGYGKQNYYRNEYSVSGGEVFKEKCHRFKSFDGKENSWKEERKTEASWSVNDPNLPVWLKKYM